MELPATRRVVGSMILVCVVACADSREPPPDVPAPYRFPLGMNDITMVMPLPSAPDETILLRIDGSDGATPIVPRDLFDRVARTDSQLDYSVAQVATVRFDLCRRDDASPCPPGVDGELRLVLQDQLRQPTHTVFDPAMHALYTIPAGEVPKVVDELHALADLAGIPTTSPLLVHPAVLGSPAYRARLRALVATYARADRLHRLALSFAFDGIMIGRVWNFRGVEIGATGAISDLLSQSVGSKSFTIFYVQPSADKPPGLKLAFDELAFEVAAAPERMKAVQALVEAQNPRKQGFADMECAACHLSSTILEHDASSVGVDPKTLPGRFTTTYDVSAKEAEFHGLGYVSQSPVISQRAANETANALVEFETQYPSAP